MAADVSNFEEWLSSRLKQLGLDEEVFGSYVTGVMDEEDSTDDDRRDALTGILEGMTEHPLEDFCSEILQRWASSRADVIKERDRAKEQKSAEKQNRLAEVMEKQASTLNPTKVPITKVDKELKTKLLAEYSHHSDEEGCSDIEEESRNTSQATAGNSNLFKNTNTQTVLDKEKEKREKLRKDNEQKKQQIKDAKEKQKVKAEERKEKEKKRTQKGERRTR